jgi:hypothetical protein
MISGNTAGGREEGYGGGVRAHYNSVFTMRGGTISGNSAVSSSGGVLIHEASTFTMEGGTIYGSSEGVNANTAQEKAVLHNESTAKWGTGGTYTKGGVSQTGGSDIGDTNDTLIAIPAK